MRTTVSIDDTLLRMARQTALKRKCSLGDVIDEALRVTFSARRKAVGTPAGKPLVTYRGSGIRASVHLDSSPALLGVMEEER